MPKAELHVNDNGTHIGIYVREDGLAVDLSAADSYQMLLQKPDGTVISPPTRTETTGVDGRIYSLSNPNWFNQAGEWRKQCTIGISGKVLHSDIVTFYVHEELG